MAKAEHFVLIFGSVQRKQIQTQIPPKLYRGVIPTVESEKGEFESSARRIPSDWCFGQYSSDVTAQHAILLNLHL